jgi:hypothetical protein
MIVIVVFFEKLDCFEKSALLSLSMELAICKSGDLDIVSPTKEDFKCYQIHVVGSRIGGSMMTYCHGHNEEYNLSHE